MSARRALVTGAAGFVGQYLIQALLRDGWDVTGAALSADAETPRLSAAERDAVRWLAADVRRLPDVERALDASRPDAVFHLAGITFVPAASADPGLTIETNVAACARLMGAVKARRAAGTLDPVVLVTGSAEQYGRHEPADFPLRESAEQRPLTVYAASKAAQEVVALEAFRSAGVRVVATRSFNHTGAGQPASFLVPALAGRVRKLARSGAGRLPIGNTTTVRDFLHVTDVVSAYILLIARGVPGEVYNVCSGRGTSVREIAERVLRLAGRDAALESDPTFVRPVEVPTLVGDNAKLRAATGWAPELTIDNILDDVIHAAT